MEFDFCFLVLFKGCMRLVRIGGFQEEEKKKMMEEKKKS